MLILESRIESLVAIYESSEEENNGACIEDPNSIKYLFHNDTWK